MPTATKNRNHRRRRARGYTLVELMVAGIISMLVLMSIYFVFISNSEQYYRQEQLVQMQEGMRFALEYLKNDLRNTGRMAPVTFDQALNPRVCLPRGAPGGGGLPLAAARLLEENDAEPAVFLNAAGIRPDRLRLLVDASPITLTTATMVGNRVLLNGSERQNSEEGRALVLATSQSQFEAVYRPGHYLHIASLRDGRSDLVPIQAVQFNPAGPTIELNGPSCLPAGVCDGGCLVNPVQLVEYAVVEDERGPQVSGNFVKTDLVRRVLDARENNAVALRTLPLAEYVVNFQAWGTYDSRVTAADRPRIAQDPTPRDARGNWLPAQATEMVTLNTRVHRLRGLNVILAVRTPREDPSFDRAGIANDPGRPGQAEVPLDQTWIDVDNRVPGVARVVTVRSEVETPNLQRGI